MDVRFKKTFTKDLEKLPSQIRVKVQELVFSKVPSFDSMQEMSDVKKIKSYESFIVSDLGITELVLN